MITMTERLDLAALYATQRLPMIRLARLLVDDTAAAEDVVQDAFVGLIRNQHKLADERSATAYLRTSVVNGSRSALRRRRTVRDFLSRQREPEPWPDVSAATLDSIATADDILTHVRRLPPRSREVLVLRYWGELSLREIAETLRISEGTVKSTLSRALDTLETSMGGPR